MGIAHRCSKCADTRFWSHLKNDADMVFRCEVATVGEGQKSFDSLLIQWFVECSILRSFG